MMKLFPLAALLLVSGCWMSDAPPDGDDPIDEAPFPDDGMHVVIPPLPVSCARTGDGEFDFRVSGQGFEAYEGVRVHASAVEPAEEGPELVAMRASGVVEDGAFQLECESAIHYNMVYPSFALYLDVDHDGACTDADLGYEELFFGWVRDIDSPIPAAAYAWFPVASGGPFSREFCELYGF